MVMTQQPSPKIATARFKTVRVVVLYVSFKSLDIYREKPNTGRTDGLPTGRAHIKSIIYSVYTQDRANC
jgi:hypothetical protein